MGVVMHLSGHDTVIAFSFIYLRKLIKIKKKRMSTKNQKTFRLREKSFVVRFWFWITLYIKVLANLQNLVISYNLGQNILRISLIFSFFEIWSSGEKVDFGLSLKCNRIYQFGRGWQTSRLYSEPCLTIFEVLDPQIIRSS